MLTVLSCLNSAELDALGENILRLYNEEVSLAHDSFLQSVMAEIEKLSVQISAAQTDGGEIEAALKNLLLCSINERLVPYFEKAGSTDAYKEFSAKINSEIEKINAIARKRKRAS